MNTKKLLMPFFMLGQFDEETTLDILCAAARAGADYLELGIPHTDPLADGDTLRMAAHEAIKIGMTPKKAVALAKKAVEKIGLPVYMLTYLNTLFGYGVEAFVRDALEAGVSGLVIPDLPLEAQCALKSEYDFKTLTLVPFTSPTSENRLSDIAGHASGFIYSVNYTGITGSGKEMQVLDKRVASNYHALKKLTKSPVLSGFGIKCPQTARVAVRSSDGVIIGTRLYEICSEASKEGAPDAVYGFLKEIKEAIG